MTTANVSSADFSNPLDQQQIAQRLWTFVHPKARHFTVNFALDVVRALAPSQHQPPNMMAKRLRQELKPRGVELKHTSALTCVAMLLGYPSWHAYQKGSSKHLLHLSFLDDSPDENFSSWQEIAPRLCAYCDAWQAKHSTNIFELYFGTRFVMIKGSAEIANSDGSRTESVPTAIVSPIESSDKWLDDSPAAFERLRRHLEESRRAILDGVAALQLCSRPVPPWAPPIPQPVRPPDARNSELVLFREDNPLLPGDGFEIARGDEMTCWSQLDLAIEQSNPKVELDEHSWRIGDGRYVWQLTTIHPHDYIPGQVNYILSADEARKLLRRYMLAKKILSGAPEHHVAIKKLDYLSGPADHYRVDLHRLLLCMHEIDLSWDKFCTEFGEQLEMKTELPIGFVFSLLERLNLKDPNAIFARPVRAELSPVHDDILLRALIPRVDHVRYRVPKTLPDGISAIVREAIADLSTSMQLQKLTATGKVMKSDPPLPYLVYASEGEELRLKLEQHNLIMFAGVMPHLISTAGLVEKQAGMWPFALGNSLFLDIDFREERARE